MVVQAQLAGADVPRSGVDGPRALTPDLSFA